MNTLKTSRRKFLGRSGSLAVALPLAAAIPAAIEVASPKKVEAASADDIRQPIPNRTLLTLAIGSFSYKVPNMPTDGTDCSKAINDAITYVVQNGGGTVFIPWQATPLPNSLTPAQCVYWIDSQANGDGTSTPYYGVLLQSGVRIECQPGVKLQAMTINTNSSKLTNRAYMFYGANPVSNVEMANCWLVGERYTHIYSTSTSTDEHCYGIALLGVSNVNIRGTIISDCTGDGICIGSSNNVAPSNITLCDVISTGNRRQGLSITAGNSISIYDSEFSYTSGTAPGDGIDIEPDAAADSVSNVTIENCVLRGNAGDGIQVNAHAASVTGINVVNCLIDYNSYAGFATQSSNGYVVNTGTVYGNAFFQNGWYGILLGDTTTNYIVGGYSSGGYDSNSFANNAIHSSGITYPNSTQTNSVGYVSASGAMNMTSGSQANNTIQWNLYCT
ncbi:right-handed parallel beta-helix repeat-containing protein [Edaphobacter flagellatus]|uniref:right-handed parallel beta-helix repeat-containing protein n=1 Tax=Edaphobacter flagellatus TaxID=1933044 RepID=UPI0021B363AE|nr:right-handed parallel beta-helix repeat-containing protein [Edaphobacter flagellatus]